jgi:hypothetical protein
LINARVRKHFPLCADHLLEIAVRLNHVAQGLEFSQAMALQLQPYRDRAHQGGNHKPLKSHHIAAI